MSRSTRGSASQTGLEDLRPAELAKFVVVLICARALPAASETIVEEEAEAPRPLPSIALILFVFVIAALASLTLASSA